MICRARPCCDYLLKKIARELIICSNCPESANSSHILSFPQYLRTIWANNTLLWQRRSAHSNYLWCAQIICCDTHCTAVGASVHSNYLLCAQIICIRTLRQPRGLHPFKWFATRSNYLLSLSLHGRRVSVRSNYLQKLSHYLKPLLHVCPTGLSAFSVLCSVTR